jgi:hypothetical protein
MIRKLLNEEKIEVNQTMIQGKYMRYDSMNRQQTRNTIVAVNAGYEYPNLMSWHAQIDIYNFNFVWCDLANHYWACPVIVSANPVVVIKGKFPYCRYFSYYSYTGIELSDNGEINFGQGITADSGNICNPTIPKNCKGFVDREIEPDDGSKNPFTDPTYKEGDNAYYTIYFVSPYYTGKLPDSKNILPLTVYGFDTAIILYRIYAPFNPKSCSSSLYSSLSSFNIKGCPPELKCDEIDTSHIKIIGNDGGAAYPQLDKTSPCKNGDNVCIKECVRFNIGNAIADNSNSECIPFIGDNMSCLCNEENNTGKCAAFVNDVVKKCTNNKGNLTNLCASLPKFTIPGCINDYYKNTSGCSSVSILTQCDEKDTECQICKYSLQTQAQSCVIEKISKSKNTDCVPFKNPVNTINLCSTDPSNSCVQEFKSDLASCLGQDPTNTFLTEQIFANYCTLNTQKQKMESMCQNEQDFVTYPLPCDASENCIKYTCQNNFCIPSYQGEYDTPDCDGYCPRYPSNSSGSSSLTYQCTVSGCLPSRNGPYSSFQDCTQSCSSHTNYTCLNNSCVRDKKGKYSTLVECLDDCSSVHSLKEGFTTVEDLISSSSYPVTPSALPTKTCVNRLDANRCNPTKQRWKNVESNYVNTTNPTLSFSTGWVGLPQVFVKYAYNDYFIKLNNQDKINTKLNLAKDIKNVMQYITTNNFINPMDVLSVTEENTITPAQYKKDILKESYMDPDEDTSKEGDEETYDCSNCVRPDTYLYNGAIFPNGKNKNTQIMAPGCNYYTDLCACENRGNKKYPSCGLYTSGRLDCKGEPCFKKWKVNQQTFQGEAEPFLLAANVGKVIIFPNPDSQYVALNTEYDERYVYVMWLDKPSAPNTPDFSNILKTDEYQLRYFSVGHYFWQMELGNPRPVLSAIQDNEMISNPIVYKDVYTNKTLHSDRVCIVLATYTQYNYMKTYGLWRENINWLNWGKTKNPSVFDLLRGLKEDIKQSTGYDETIQIIEQYMNGSLDTLDLLQFLENFITNPKYEYSSFTVKNIIQAVMKELRLLRTPQYGIVLCRQLLANESFTESIANYASNPKNSCINPSIPINDPMKPPIYPPMSISKSCNPGNPELCESLGLDPCCLATDLLYHMKQYYPRCERVKICDIEKKGSSFWTDYLFSPLPYDVKND